MAVHWDGKTNHTIVYLLNDCSTVMIMIVMINCVLFDLIYFHFFFLCWNKSSLEIKKKLEGMLKKSYNNNNVKNNNVLQLKLYTKFE